VLLDSGRLQEEFSKRENRWERRHPDRAEAEDARDRATLEAAIELAEAGEEGAAPTPAAAAFAAGSREVVDDAPTSGPAPARSVPAVPAVPLMPRRRQSPGRSAMRARLPTRKAPTSRRRSSRSMGRAGRTTRPNFGPPGTS